MEWYRSEKKDAMYLKKTLKKRKTTRSRMEKGASASGHNMKEEHIVEEREPVASSTLNDKEKTAMSQSVKARAALCSIHDENFRNAVEKHELGVGEVE